MTHRLLFHAMNSQYQYSMDITGNMFIDVPHYSNFEELVSLANDKVFWKSLESTIPSHLRKNTICIHVHGNIDTHHHYLLFVYLSMHLCEMCGVFACLLYLYHRLIMHQLTISKLFQSNWNFLSIKQNTSENEEARKYRERDGVTMWRSPNIFITVCISINNVATTCTCDKV